MTSKDRITLYYSPQTRATGTRVLLEELGAPYDLHVLNMKAGEQRQPAYLAVNPLGKVPVIRHGEALVTEQVAIYIYLADLFPEAGLTPALDDPSRGPVSALDRLLWFLLRTGPDRQVHEARAGPRDAIAIFRLRDHAWCIGGAAFQGTLFARRAHDGGRHSLGRGVQLDDDVWPRAAKGRICGLCRAHHVAARLPADQRRRCRDGGAARRGLRRVSGTVGAKKTRQNENPEPVPIPSEQGSGPSQNFGGRFSANALMPSLISALRMLSRWRRSAASSSSLPRANSLMARFMPRIASGALPARMVASRSTSSSSASSGTMAVR